MNLARRDWLKLSAVAGASLLSAVSKSAVAFGQSSRTDNAGQRWGSGFDPGQTLPPEASNGPWQSLRAVREKKVFDSHCHSWGPLPGHNQVSDNTNSLIAAMDAHGIEHAVLAPSRAVYETVMTNDIAPHPDRFIRATGMPTNSTKGKELTPDILAEQTQMQLERDGCRILGELTGDGLMNLQSRYSPKELKPVMDLVRKYDVPVQLHTGWSPGSPHPKPDQDMRQYVEIAARVIRSWPEYAGALLAEYPDVKFILAHIGGPLAIPDGHEALRLLFWYDNAYVDTSTSPVEIISEAVRGVGAERVMFASDWHQPGLEDSGPFHMRAIYTHWWNLNNIANAELTEDQRDWILYKSARKLLKLPEV